MGGRARHFATRSAAVLLLLALASGLLVLRPAAGAGSGRVQLQGRVFRPDGRPAARARVYIDVWRQGLVPVTTDARARYTLPLEDRSRQWIEAVVPHLGVSKLLQVVPARQGATPLDIRLSPLPLVSGVIFLPDGRPAAGATFEARGALWRDLESMMELGAEPRPPGIPGSQGKAGGPLFKIVTDSTGHYEVRLFPDQAPEHLSLFGSETKYQIRLVSGNGHGWSDVVSFATNLDHPAVHQDIALHAGERVEGKVVGYPGGTPMAGASIYALVPGLGPAPLNRPEVVGGAVSDSQGRFRVATALQPGGYMLGVNAGAGWGFIGAAETEPQGVVQLGRRWVELQLVRDAHVHGRLLDPDGTPAGKMQLPVTIRTVGDGDPGEYTADLETNAEGRYELDFRASWETRQLWGRGVRRAVISMRSKDTVIPPVTVDLTKASDQEVDLRLAETGSAFGQVTLPDGRPAGGVSVYLAPAPEQASRWGTAELRDFYDRGASVRIVNREGNFDLRGVPPGDYFLVVRACTIYETFPEDGTALPVTIAPGAAAGPLHVIVRPRSELHGRLFGLPAAQNDEEAEATLDCIMRPTGTEARARRVRLDLENDGRYAAWTSGYGMGSYDIVFLATREGRAYVSEVQHGVALKASSVREGLDFTLSPGGSVSGRLAQSDGKGAVAGMEVVLRPLSGDATMLFPLLICGDDDMGERAFLTEADKKGEFSFGGLLPGRYELSVAWRPPRAAEAEILTMSLNLDRNEHRAGLVIRLPQAVP